MAAATAHDWLQGARPHTWPNAFAPVIIGTGVAIYYHGAHIGRALLALVVAWSLIIAVNYANDYSDGIRGTDEDRSGPTRLTASGLAQPKQVRNAAFLALATAGLAGIILAALSSWWLIVVGLCCIIAAWTYTGGKNPYGYKGYGEVSVFVFFGLVAVLGTEFSQRGSMSWLGLLCAISVGSISAAVNLANNLRDIPTDQASGKITLAVRLGDTRTRQLYQVLVCLPFCAALICVSLTPWSILGLSGTPFAIQGIQTVRKGAKAQALIPVLQSTGRAMALWAVGLAFALSIAG